MMFIRYRQVGQQASVGLLWHLKSRGPNCYQCASDNQGKQSRLLEEGWGHAVDATQASRGQTQAYSIDVELLQKFHMPSQISAPRRDLIAIF